MSYVQPKIKADFISNLSEANGRCFSILYWEYVRNFVWRMCEKFEDFNGGFYQDSLNET